MDDEGKDKKVKDRNMKQGNKKIQINNIIRKRGMAYPDRNKNVTRKKNKENK